MALPRLTYFSSRGRAELIRLVLAEAGVAYEEQSLGPWHPVDKTPAFLALKASGTLAFGMVPLWEEPGGLRLTQSDAIARHVARTHGLHGASTRETARCDEVLFALDDLRVEIRKLFTAPAEAREALREELRARTLPRWFAHFERMIVANGDDGSFLVGGAPSIADLALFQVVEVIRDNDLASSLAGAPRVAALVDRTCARPRVARHVASPGRFPAAIAPP